MGRWDWNNVAREYASLVRNNTHSALTLDPFRVAPPTAATAQWNGSNIALFNGKAWNFFFLAPFPSITMGTYALYIDVDVQACPGNFVKLIDFY